MNRRTLVQLLVTAPLVSELNLAGDFRPKCFSAHQYGTLSLLCEQIIPADETAGGAIEARVPELIDLLASENEDHQRGIAGGIGWLDAECQDRFGAAYRDCRPADQKSMLDLIAYRENADHFPGISQGISFFIFLRDLTLGGYFTSAIGIRYLPYLGNRVVPEFLGCPPLPRSETNQS